MSMSKSKNTTTKKVPKLRRMLKELGACMSARMFYDGLTLSEAWAKKATNEITRGGLLIDRAQILRWKRWLVHTASVQFPRFYDWDDPPTLRYNKKQKIIIPTKPPAVLLKHWDGYEIRKRAVKKKSK